MKKVIIALVVVALLGGAALWYFVLRDESLEVSNKNIDSAQTSKTIPEQSTPDGTWIIEQQGDVFVGYSIEEVFGGESVTKTAVGKSNEVTGTFTVENSKLTEATIEVDMTALQSDDSQRDSRMENDGLETDEFPTATFTLAGAQDITSIEKNVDVTLNVTGQLELHGETQDVSFPLTANWNGKVITLSGELEIILSDFKISPPDTSFVKVEDQGTIKVQLLFIPES